MSSRCLRSCPTAREYAVPPPAGARTGSASCGGRAPLNRAGGPTQPGGRPHSTGREAQLNASVADPEAAAAEPVGVLVAEGGGGAAGAEVGADDGGAEVVELGRDHAALDPLG